MGGILGEVAIRSGGEIIHIVSTEHGQHIAGNTVRYERDDSNEQKRPAIGVIKVCGPETDLAGKA